MLILKRILLFFLCFVCFYPAAIAQEKEFAKAIQKGQKKEGLIWCNTKGRITVQQFQDWKQTKPNFFFFDCCLSARDKNNVDAFSFLQEKEAFALLYGQLKQYGTFEEPFESLRSIGKAYLYRGCSQGEGFKMDILPYTRRGKPIPFMEQYSNVYWSGSVQDGLLQGEGTGIAFGNGRWVCFHGAFDKGFPVGLVQSYWHSSHLPVRLDDYVYPQDVIVQPFTMEQAVFFADGFKGTVNRQGIGTILFVKDQSMLDAKDKDSILEIQSLIDGFSKNGLMTNSGTYRLCFPVTRGTFESMTQAMVLITDAFDTRYIPFSFRFSQGKDDNAKTYYELDKYLRSPRDNATDYIWVSFFPKTYLPQYYAKIKCNQNLPSMDKMKVAVNTRALTLELKAERNHSSDWYTVQKEVWQPKDLHNMLWSGSVRMGRPDGKGLGICFMPNQMLVFSGTFKNGLPSGDVTIRRFDYTFFADGEYRQKELTSYTVRPFAEGYAKVMVKGQFKMFIDEALDKAFDPPVGDEGAITDFVQGYAYYQDSEKNDFLGAPLKYRVDCRGQQEGPINANKEMFTKAIAEVTQYLDPLVSVFNKQDIYDPCDALIRKGVKMQDISNAIGRFEFDSESVTLKWRDEKLLPFFQQAIKENPKAEKEMLLVRQLNDFYVNLLTHSNVNMQIENLMNKANTDPLTKSGLLFDKKLYSPSDIIGYDDNYIEFIINQNIDEVEALFANPLFSVTDRTMIDTVQEMAYGAKGPLIEARTNAYNIIYRRIDERDGNIPSDKSCKVTLYYGSHNSYCINQRIEYLVSGDDRWYKTSTDDKGQCTLSWHGISSSKVSTIVVPSPDKSFQYWHIGELDIQSGSTVVLDLDYLYKRPENALYR